MPAIEPAGKPLEVFVQREKKLQRWIWISVLVPLALFVALMVMVSNELKTFNDLKKQVEAKQEEIKQYELKIAIQKEELAKNDLALGALRMALSQRRVEPGMVHHSDRGSQYASGDYTDLLKANGIEISMSRKANPWDNAACESFMKTLKYEEVHRNEYRDLAEARREIGTFLEKIYNHKRLHSALGYMPPAEFESSFASKPKEAAVRQLSL